MKETISKQIIKEKVLYIKKKYKKSVNSNDMILNIPRKEGKYISDEIDKSLKY